METISNSNIDRQLLPDVSLESQADLSYPLDRVGMSEIEMPVLFDMGDGRPVLTPSLVEAYVSLDDPNSKGIHMSRLYEVLGQALPQKPLNFSSIQKILELFVSSQKGISRNAFLKISLTLMTQRKALVSDKLGWRQYPIFLEAKFVNGKLEMTTGVKVAYSSTCPCSAALAKQLILEKFEADFAQIEAREIMDKSQFQVWLRNNVLLATPHAQRSYADVQIQWKNGVEARRPLEIIESIEGALKTVVQSAVKREDEQEFAKLNGTNLMFCEDAARRIKKMFNTHPSIENFLIKVDHQESLHPHNAVSYASKDL